MTPTPTQLNIQTALRSFLLAVLPGPGIDATVFAGTIAGTTLTVTKMVAGVIIANALVLGAAPGTTIVTQLTGPTGQAGTYQVSVSQALSVSTTMASGVDIVQGQPNRVVEPPNPFFAVMTLTNFERLETTVDAAADVKFKGSIASTTLTVSSVQIGTINQGASVFGPGVTNPTTIIQQLTGTPGGIGTYQISVSQTVASATLSAGAKTLTQNAKVTVQVDFHSSDTTAGDFAQAVSTALRDEYGVNFFAGLTSPLNGVVPLYADNPKQVPFLNAEQQYEWRWSLDVCLQVDQTIAVPQQYADSSTVTVNGVTALYP